jgi:hypothetical protein
MRILNVTKTQEPALNNYTGSFFASADELTEVLGAGSSNTWNVVAEVQDEFTEVSDRTIFKITGNSIDNKSVSEWTIQGNNIECLWVVQQLLKDNTRDYYSVKEGI